ncbi:hypothetical protein DFH09DRAFT_1131049 [Mycena vulgaris]|nr:hypothetical protein DFH09DRAFT_1131049 [Mycena vulgaris]
MSLHFFRFKPRLKPGPGQAKPGSLALALACDFPSLIQMKPSRSHGFQAKPSQITKIRGPDTHASSHAIATDNDRPRAPTSLSIPQCRMSTTSATAGEVPTTKVVLVMLATGKQGGAVTRALAQANRSAADGALPWLILAQTRDTASAKSKALDSLPGVRLHKGSPDDPGALFTSAPAPVYAVFSVQQSADNPTGVKGELVQAKALADAAAKHGVKHFVYTSVNFGGVPGDKTYVPHFESKRLAEQHLKEKHPTLPTTILRPVTFMDQLVTGDPKSATTRITKIMFLSQLKPTTRLQFIAVSDIGAMAALVLREPERYLGRDVDLAGDHLSAKDLEDGWREVFGEEMRSQMMGGTLLAWAVLAGMKELRLMFRFFNEIGFNVDIPALRAQYPALKDWKTFLREEVQKPEN